MKLELSNSDFYSVACPLGDEDERWYHIGSVISNSVNRFYCKVCMDMTWANVDNPDKLCPMRASPPKSLS